MAKENIMKMVGDNAEIVIVQKYGKILRMIDKARNHNSPNKVRLFDSQYGLINLLDKAILPHLVITGQYLENGMNGNTLAEMVKRRQAEGPYTGIPYNPLILRYSTGPIMSNEHFDGDIVKFNPDKKGDPLELGTIVRLIDSEGLSSCIAFNKIDRLKERFPEIKWYI